MVNPKCLKCTELPNYRGGNTCECNDEVRCARCNHCTWCINDKLNGNCVENHHATRERCVNLRHHHKKHHGLSKKDMYIIVGCVVGGVLLIVLLIIFLNRR